MWNGQRVPQFSIEATAITHLKLEGDEDDAPASMQRQDPHKSMQDAGQQNPSQQPFADPAILHCSPAKEPDLPTPTQPQSMRTSATHPVGNTLPLTKPPATGYLNKSFSKLNVNDHASGNGEQEITQDKELQFNQRVDSSQKTTGRNNTRRLNQGYPAHSATASTNLKSRGWRQTAFVESTVPDSKGPPKAVSVSARNIIKKKTPQSYTKNTSGWAKEDVSDIQELGDFDFQSNLSKFDKRQVFEEIRNDDTTADEERLVSFNRKVKPGTNGGKNLHWTENVLDSPQNSDTGDDEISEARHSSDRSKPLARVQTRKSSGIVALPMPQISAISRNQRNITRTTSPRPGRSSVSPMVGSTASGASLRLMTTNRSCPTASPLQTLEVEQIASAEFGLSEDIITENAGRGIAEAATALLSSDTAAPTILIITGNHRTGARAISAARHLRNRGHRVTLCLLGLEHETELLENCRKQLEIFRKIGGRVMKWEDLSPRLSTSDLSPDLVIDALFGMHLAFDDLRTDDQGVAFEMISWVNRSGVEVLSVDIPSGISASGGRSHTPALYLNLTNIIFRRRDNNCRWPSLHR